MNKGRKADRGGRAVCEVYDYMEKTCHAHMGWSQLNENYEHLKIGTTATVGEIEQRYQGNQSSSPLLAGGKHLRSLVTIFKL